jgi:hypothetical protein
MTSPNDSRFGHLPVSYPPDYDIQKPNQEVPVFSGAFDLIQGDAVTPLQGELRFRWVPAPALRFRATGSTTGPIDTGEAILRIPGALQKPTAALLTLYEIGAEGAQYSGSVNDRLCLGKSGSVHELRFELMNFHSFIGSSVQLPHSNGAYRGRLALTGGGLDLMLDQVPQYSKRIHRVKDEGGFITSHSGVIARSDRGEIGENDLDDLLHLLHVFCSFSCGRWTTPVFPRGIGDSGVLWTQFAPWRLSRWKDVGSWFPRQNPTELTKLWDGFVGRWKDPEWQYPLSIAVHWYVEANTGSGAIEGAIVLTQTALELLGWCYLVEEKRKFGSKEYNQLPAADKIEHLLRELNIPTVIPAHLEALKSAADTLGVVTGPAVFVRLRNGIVHPKKSKREEVRSTEVQARWEALQLGLLFVELSILALSGYEGTIYNRTKSGYPSEIEEFVPWSMKTVAEE